MKYTILTICLGVSLIGALIRNQRIEQSLKKEIDVAALNSFKGGFSVASNMLYDEDGCALGEVPNLDSLYKVTFRK